MVSLIVEISPLTTCCSKDVVYRHSRNVNMNNSNADEAAVQRGDINATSTMTVVIAATKRTVVRFEFSSSKNSISSAYPN